MSGAMDWHEEWIPVPREKQGLSTPMTISQLVDRLNRFMAMHGDLLVYSHSGGKAPIIPIVKAGVCWETSFICDKMQMGNKHILLELLEDS